MTIQIEKILQLLEEYPLLLPRYDYGTAGFRYDAKVMAPVMVRVGLISKLLLQSSSSGSSGDHDHHNTTTTSILSSSNMGVMLTASHNDESYNGIKVADPDGSMLHPQGEMILIQWVNESNINVWKEMLEKLIMTEEEDSTTTTTTSIWHVGRDTRSHSEGFSNLFIQAAIYMGVTIQDHGIITTPMLHQIVLMSNNTPNANNEDEGTTTTTTTNTATKQVYLEQLAKAYMELDTMLTPTTTTTSTTSMNILQIDGACGVGYSAVQELIQVFQRLEAETEKETTGPIVSQRFQARNPPGSGPLNEQCGSEHVQKLLQPPIWYDDDKEDKASSTSSSIPYACSVDGDADRIVFWSTTTTTTTIETESSSSSSSSSSWTLLDGDKIAALIAQFFQEILLQQHTGDSITPHTDLSIGVVQTAYANGASTKFLQDTLKVPVIITKTGVKYLHHAAQEFDIGIYFEANGHGTVLFSDKYKSAAQISPLLTQLYHLINPAVGDALSDLLLVDLLLRRKQWSLQDWYDKLYTDLPSRQLKVYVQDRSMIVCNDNETQALKPDGLQSKLVEAATTKSIEDGRCFVRPSGTEDVVRIYAEGKTRIMADTLAIRVAQIVYEECQGKGPIPDMSWI